MAFGAVGLLDPFAVLVGIERWVACQIVTSTLGDAALPVYDEKSLAAADKGKRLQDRHSVSGREALALRQRSFIPEFVHDILQILRIIGHRLCGGKKESATGGNI